MLLKILESGSAASLPLAPASSKEVFWQNFTGAVPSCASLAQTQNTLDCLRKANTTEISIAVEIAVAAGGDSYVFIPALDGPGGLLPCLPSSTLREGGFSRLPFIAGTNLDEGDFLMSYLRSPRCSDSDPFWRYRFRAQFRDIRFRADSRTFPCHHGPTYREPCRGQGKAHGRRAA